MRKLFQSSLLIFLTLIISLSSLYAAPALQLEPAVHDFGKLRKGEQATAVFNLQNTGDEMVMIRFMDMSVQGLIAQVNPRIEPGSTVKIIVNWDTTNLEGEVEGKIVLGFSDTEIPDVVVNVKGDVEPIAESSSEAHQ